MGKTENPFVDSLILCPLIRIIVVDCPLEPMTCLATVLGPNDGDRHGFQCVNQALNTKKKYLATPMIFLPLMNQGSGAARPVTTIVDRVHTLES